MLMLFLFFQIFSITLQDYDYTMVIDSLFIENNEYDISLKNCQSENFYYKGRPENITNMKNKYDSYSSVYIPSNYYDIDRIIKQFPKSTIFITQNDFLINKDYCFIVYNSNYDYSINDKLSSKYYFIIIGKDGNTILEYYLIFFLVIFSIILFLFFLFYSFKCSNVVLIRLYVTNLTNKYIILSLLLSFSCVYTYYVTPIISIAHSFYKTFIIVHIIYLLSGYQVLYFNQNVNIKKKFILIVLFFQLITKVLFTYIIYFIPSLDNFYLYFIKSLIEHITILVILVKMFLNNFINLYKQYRLERRMRTILTLAYKYKLLIYSKIFIFSLLYSLGFIVMNIIQICYYINYYIYGFKYNYFMDIALELFFNIILGILFYPIKSSTFYYFQVNYDFNGIIFVTEIKKNKEKSMKINNLNKKNLKDEYLKKEYPIILVEPFSKTHKIVNERFLIHIGVAKKSQ